MSVEKGDACMFWNAKNNSVSIDGTDMYYVSFGKGNSDLIIIPGLGDGLATVKGMAILLSIIYRVYTSDYKVFVFSRKNNLEEGYTTRDMARDLAEAIKLLGIGKAKVVGISQGGMIAQYLAIDYPELVEKLVLAVTSSRKNEMLEEVVSNWITLANKKDYKSLVIDTIEKTYSESYLKRYNIFYPFIGLMYKSKDSKRFIIQAKACISHDAYSELEKILCPTLIIGGENDKIVGVDASIEIADKIRNSELYIYKGLGHGTYEEAKDFNSRVLDYLREQVS